MDLVPNELVEDELSLPVAPVNKLIKEAVPNHRVSFLNAFPIILDIFFILM
jgi:hypothetical protein